MEKRAFCYLKKGDIWQNITSLELPIDKQQIFPLFFILGLDKIEFLQSHENQDIYQKAFDLIEHYFGTEDEDSSIAPQVDLSQQQYIFQQCEAPMEGFQL